MILNILYALDNRQSWYWQPALVDRAFFTSVGSERRTTRIMHQNIYYEAKLLQI